MQQRLLSALRDEGNGAFDNALVRQNAAVAETVGPVQPHMAAGACVAFRVLGRHLTIVRRVDDQRRHRSLGKLAVAGEFMQRPAGQVLDTVRHRNL